MCSPAPCTHPPARSARLLSVSGLEASYATAEGKLRAVDRVSFDVAPGETLALVGESGCGKSTLGKTLLRLVPSTGGRIAYGGSDITHLSGRALKPFRQRMQMVFQDPSASLNPRHTTYRILETPLIVHGVRGRTERRRIIEATAERVGLAQAALGRYPHEFSGGQKQRIGIARALVLRPEIIVCDEPVSALDVSIQAQILNLLVDLREAYQLSYLFISHDLGVVRYIADAVAVMYLGRIVERAPHRLFWSRPLHPYTRALIDAVPGQGRGRVAPVAGDLPNAVHPPTGCYFHPRCPIATERCRTEEPVLREVIPQHNVACHHAT